MALEEVGVKLLAEDASKFDKEMRESRAAFDSFIDALERGTRGIDDSMGRAERATDDFADSSEANFRRVDGMTEILIGGFRRVGEAVVNMAFDAGAALAGFVADSVTVAGDYEATLNKFSAVTGDAMSQAGMEVDDFSDLFLELGATTVFSAQEAADAAVELAKGGIAPATIAAGGLEATLNLAAAGGLELAAAGEIVAKQLGVWADKGVDAEEVTNLLAQAANASTVDVDELANGLASAQGRAAAMGVEYDDLVQTMATIAPGFNSASEAGTSLNNFLARLIPTTDAAKDAMADLGLATSDGQSVFFDAQGNFIGMEATIGLLSSATAGLSEEEKSLALQTIFGNDAMGAAALLAAQGVPAYNAMGEAMATAGTAAEQADAMNRGWNASVSALMGSIETGQISVIKPFLDSMAPYVDMVTQAVNATFAWAASIASADDPMAALVSSIDEVVPGFASFLDTIAAIPSKVTEISNAFQDDFAPEIQLAQAIFETAMIVIEDITTAVLDTVTGAIEEFTKTFDSKSATWINLSKELETLWIALEPIIAGVLATLGAAFLVFVGVVTGVFTGILNAIDPFLQGLTFVLGFVSMTLDGIREVVMGFVDLVVSLFQGNTDGILDAFIRMDNGIRTIILGLVGGVLSAIGTLVVSAIAFVQGLYEGVVGFFQSLYDDLVGHSIIPDLVNGILKWFSDLNARGIASIAGLVDDIKAIFTETDWGALGRGIIDGIIEGITGLAGSLATAAQQAASDAYNAVTDFLGMESPSKLFMEVGEMTMQGFALGIDDSASLPALSLEDAAATLALEMPSVMGGSVAGLAPAPVVNNTYATTNVYEAPSYDLNVRTQESVGSIGNTIRGLQSISRIRGGG